VAKNSEHTLKLRSTTAEEFTSAISDDPADKFANTFIAKANMQGLWDKCIGLWDGDQLAGAIITTVSKRSPKVANLQLLHTFAAHRGKGVARILCEDSLERVKGQATYFRVSSEIPAIKFYEKIGFTFQGKQKSGCQLSIFRINNTFADSYYQLDDPVIYSAVHKKGKGGCVEVFLESPKGLEDFF